MKKYTKMSNSLNLHVEKMEYNDDQCIKSDHHVQSDQYV